MLNKKWIASAVCVAAMAVSTVARAEARVFSKRRATARRCRIRCS
ncbi:hypothetical protein C7S13_2007 [Burkholderia cepacia]|nr:hypothetical protein [Burkholderia cepacia]